MDVEMAVIEDIDDDQRTRRRPGIRCVLRQKGHGQLVDKDGQPVADPGPWAFRALAQNGYYRRPKGYVSPEEQILLDQEEVRALLAAWKKAEQAQFEVWRDGLSPEELARAMSKDKRYYL